MNDEDYYTHECKDCTWLGGAGELVCSEEDYLSDKEIDMIDFNRCPECDSKNVVEVHKQGEAK